MIKKIAGLAFVSIFLLIFSFSLSSLAHAQTAVIQAPSNFTVTPGVAGSGSINYSFSFSGSFTSFSGYVIDASTQPDMSNPVNQVIVGGIGNSPVKGSFSSFKLTSGTKYYFAAKLGNGTSNGPYSNVSSLVLPSQPRVNISAVPDTSTSGIKAGQSVLLSWSSDDVTSCVASGGWQGVMPTSGSQSVVPTQTTTYRLNCTNSVGGAGISSVTVFVSNSLVANLSSAQTGDSNPSYALTWSSTNASACTSTGFNSNSQTSGSVIVVPTQTTTYTLTCTNSDGISSLPSSVTITPQTQAPSNFTVTPGVAGSGSINYSFSFSGSFTSFSGYVIDASTQPDMSNPVNQVIVGGIGNSPVKGSFSSFKLTSGTKYYFAAKLGNGTSNGPYSNVSSLVLPGQPPTAVTATKFSTGDTVETTSTLNVRSSANGLLLGQQLLNSFGTIAGGPISAAGSNWWNVSYDNQPSGWSAEDFLNKATRSAPTVPINPITPTPPKITPTTPITLSSTKFSTGDTVETTSVLNVRSSANGLLLGQQLLNSFGTIAGGPISAAGSNWWNVSYDNQPSGWSAEDFLVKATRPTITTTPTTPTGQIPTVTANANPTSVTAGQASVITVISPSATCKTNLGANFTNSAQFTVSPTQTTTYSFTCTSSGGQSATASVTITVNDQPSIQNSSTCSAPLSESQTISCPSGQTGSITQVHTKFAFPNCTFGAFTTVSSTCTTINNTPTTLTAPAGLSASAGSCNSGSVNISWGGVNGAASYSVARSSALSGPYGSPQGSTGITSTSFTDSGLGNSGATLYYEVQAVNGSNSSPNSNPVSVVGPAVCRSNNCVDGNSQNLSCPSGQTGAILQNCVLGDWITTANSCATPQVGQVPVVTASAEAPVSSAGWSDALSWASTNNATSCTWSDMPTVNFGPVGSRGSSPTVTTTYTVTCTNSVGSGSTSVTITISPSSLNIGTTNLASVVVGLETFLKALQGFLNQGGQ